MAQVRIYGRRDALARHRAALSDSVHAALMSALGLAGDKRFHRFIGLEADDFVHPPDRSHDYTIIEICMFEGRTAEAKATLIDRLFENVRVGCGIAPHDVEITLYETPMAHWGIRGMRGDQLQLPYRVSV